MHRFRLFLFLVMCVVFLVCSKTLASEEESVEYDIVCEGSMMMLRCFNTSLVITIQSAIYGRKLPGSILCPTLHDTPSSMSDELTCNTDVYSIVKERCESNTNCTIPTNKNTLGEPCPNVYKYLDVAFKCEDKLTRGIRQIIHLSRVPTVIIPTSTAEPARISVSTVQIEPTPLMKQKLNTVYKRLNKSSTLSPTSTTSTSYSVSVSRVSQRQFTTTAITNLRSTTLISTSPSNPARKTTENKTVQTHADLEEHGSMKLFHFILSFQIVRQEKLEKHTANSIVWFFLGLLLGLLIMIAVFMFYRVRRSRKRRKGKPEKSLYLKQDILLGEMDENVELNSKKLEALEMESQFGETV